MLPSWASLGLHLGLGLGEDRRLLDREPDPQPEDHQHRAEQERDPPAPVEEGLLALHRGQHPQHPGGEQVAERDARLRPGGPEAALVVAAVLGGHQHRTAPLTADREALHQAADHEQDRRRDPDGGVRRQQADREGADPHHQQRDDQHRLAPDLVAEVAEDHPAQGAGREAQRVGHEGVERAVGAADLAEEDLAEDQRGGGAEEEEVVPLDGRADQAGRDDPHDRALARGSPAGAFAVRGARAARELGVGCHLCVPFTRRSSRRPSGGRFR